MGYVKCKVCDGSGKKYVYCQPRRGEFIGKTKEFTCRACGGSGLNDRLRTVSCERCGGEVVYPAHSDHPPKYCKSCKEDLKAIKEAKWRTTYCSGCSSAIKYNVDWDKIPKFCPSCRDRNKREREIAQAKWKEKSCSDCGATIKYNVDWSKIPDLCKSCIEKKKEATRELTKACAGCGATIKYRAHWQNVPNFCNDCKKRRISKDEPNNSQNKRFYAAAKSAGLSSEEARDFSSNFHSGDSSVFRKNMSFDELKQAALEWKRN